MNENMRYLIVATNNTIKDLEKLQSLKDALTRDIIPKLEDCKELEKEKNLRIFLVTLSSLFGREKVIVKITSEKIALVHHQSCCISKNIDLQSNFFRQ